MSKCERCGEQLKGKQLRWCSLKCSKLGLKALYKKRKKEQINAYNRKIRATGVRAYKSDSKYLQEFFNRNPYCAKCGNDNVKDLHVCHIKPRHCGGKHKDNIIVFCRKHHHEFDVLLKSFWS